MIVSGGASHWFEVLIPRPVESTSNRRRAGDWHLLDGFSPFGSGP
ncbi:hypothetical protein HMPREF1979_01364 [Actinomyces johnsonii F0542]|uniref:Uncharacterized protein n=1 Tax=Actinomyces johnsonii F0542 TaxID=1321818 RepID=U1RXC8_9ACTO|nr:hypothetical protein HMPREF1979_01364 [Actinomyces johnsonii F0542]